MDDSKTYNIIERRADGSFIIAGKEGPYQVEPDYCPELWAAVCAQEGLDAEAEATKYREAIGN